MRRADDGWRSKQPLFAAFRLPPSALRSVPANLYWYWMYTGLGSTFSTCSGVRSLLPFFVSLW